MYLKIKVSRSCSDVLLAIKSVLDEQDAEAIDVELDANEYYNLMKETSGTDMDGAFRGFLSGIGFFLGIPVKRKQ